MDLIDDDGEDDMFGVATVGIGTDVFAGVVPELIDWARGFVVWLFCIGVDVDIGATAEVAEVPAVVEDTAAAVVDSTILA